MELTNAEQELVAYMAGDMEKAFTYALLDDSEYAEENKQTVEALQERIEDLENKNYDINRQLEDSDVLIAELDACISQLKAKLLD